MYSNHSVDVTINALPNVDGPDIDLVMEILTLAEGAVLYLDNGVNDVTAVPTVTTTYTLTGTDANGCSNTDVVDVTVNVLPAVDGGTDINVCDESVTLSASGALTYAWIIILLMLLLLHQR